jgi:hypothetical protein
MAAVMRNNGQGLGGGGQTFPSKAVQGGFKGRCSNVNNLQQNLLLSFPILADELFR